MIEDPDRYIDAFIDAGSNIITVHAETVVHLHRTVHYIKRKGVKAGVSLNPSTPLCCIEEILPDIDLLLIMTVNPGFGGQKFISGMLPKIRKAKDFRQAKTSALRSKWTAALPPKTSAASLRKGHRYCGRRRHLRQCLLR